MAAGCGARARVVAAAIVCGACGEGSGAAGCITLEHVFTVAVVCGSGRETAGFGTGMAGRAGGAWAAAVPVQLAAPHGRADSGRPSRQARNRSS